MDNIIFPHDRMFRASMSNRRVAKEFFERHLPENILRLVNLEVLHLSPESYVDADLKLTQSDILYQTIFLNKKAYLYLLCEQQSQPEVLMPFRLLKYCVSIWNDFIKQQTKKVEKLPLIFPIVFYSGKEPYNYSMDFKCLLDAPLDIVDDIWGKPFCLINVHDISDDELVRHHWSGIMEFFMKHAFARDFLIPLEKAMVQLSCIERAGGEEYVLALLNYALKSTKMSSLKKFTRTVNQHLTRPTGEKIMTLAEQLIETGVRKGIQQGMQQGMQQGEHLFFLRLLKRKFPNLSNDYLSMIKEANEEMLLVWGDKLLEAQTLSDVFEE